MANDTSIAYLRLAVKRGELMVRDLALPFGAQASDQQSEARRTRVRPSGRAPSCQVATKASQADAARAIKTIVLADDDQSFLEATTGLLRVNGYAVHTAGDGLETLALIRQIKPECVILSVVLPKLDGAQVCAALRQDPDLCRTPIIVFSSLGRKDYALFPDLSADAYVAKGPLAAAAQNLLQAIRSFEGQIPVREGLLLGYHNFRARPIVSALLLERHSLRTVCELLAPRALVLTPDGRIVMANTGACEILGRPRAKIVGEHLSALLPFSVQHELYELLDAFKRSEPPGSGQTTFRLSGERVAARFTPIVEGRTHTGLVVILEREASSSAMGSEGLPV